MSRHAMLALVLAPAVALSLLGAMPAVADTAFDGVWDVRLVTESGPCRASRTSSISISSGRVVLLEDTSIAVSGGVGAGGALNVGLSRLLISGAASGRLAARSGSGSWRIAVFGCSGRWNADRRVRTAQAS